jgi:hypothetical protein
MRTCYLGVPHVGPIAAETAVTLMTPGTEVRPVRNLPMMSLLDHNFTLLVATALNSRPWAAALFLNYVIGKPGAAASFLASLMVTCYRQGKRFLDLARRLWQSSDLQAIDLEALPGS